MTLFRVHPGDPNKPYCPKEHTDVTGPWTPKEIAVLREADQERGNSVFTIQAADIFSAETIVVCHACEKLGIGQAYKGKPSKETDLPRILY